MALFDKSLWRRPVTPEDEAEALEAYHEIGKLSPSFLLESLRVDQDHWCELKRRLPGLRPDEYQGNHEREYEMGALEAAIKFKQEVISEFPRSGASVPSVAAASAEPGASIGAPIPEPGSDAALEIAPGVNVPTAEVRASTSPTPLELLNRIHRQLGPWDLVARQIKWTDPNGQEIKVSRSMLLDWRRTQLGKDPSKRVNAATAQKIADSIRRVAVELRILPS